MITPIALLFGGIVAGVTLALLGWQALGRGRPIVLSTRWFLPSALLLVAIEPLAALFRQVGDPPSGPNDATLRLVVLVAAPLLFALFAARRLFSGYSVFGVDIHVVRKALVASLRGLGLDYEVREKVYRLRPSGAELELAEGTPKSTVRISVKRRADDALLRTIVDSIRACLQSESVALAPGKCTRWIATGLAIAISCGLGVALLWNAGA